MKRKAFDRVVAAVGVLLAGLLLVAGSLLAWAHHFVSDEVSTQLSQQQITFPAAGSEQLSDPAVAPFLTKYAGQQLTTGEQAKAYADHYIAVHLKAIGGGKTYSQLSTESLANPDDAALAGKVQTVFRGETLRGLLLDAYAFGKMGQIALYAAWVAFAGAAMMLLLSALGIRHARAVDDQVELFTADPRVVGV
jgi:hypothetical protein